MIRAQNQGLGTSQPVPVLSPFPGWARHDTSPAAPPGKDLLAEAAFTAGAALAALVARVHAAAPWSGAWRRRLALKAAAASVKNARRGEDELLLRDSFVLCPAGGDPGPGGRLLLAWRELDRSDPLADFLFSPSPKPWACPLTTLCAARSLRPKTSRRRAGGRHSPRPTRSRPCWRTAPTAELFALWLADAVLARRLGWPLPVPLLAAALLHPSLRTAGRRPHPANPGWTQACCAAYALAAAQACDLHAELGRRATKLLATVPQLRAKGADAIVETLLGRRRRSHRPGAPAP